MAFLKISFAYLGITAATTVLGAVFPNPTTVAIPATACIEGAPTTTAGYPILYYTQATPVAGSSLKGYQPEPRWASEHFVTSYTFGVPPPVETGFAYAQFKCEYYCQNIIQNQDPPDSGGGSFFVRADSRVGSYCECYDEIMNPETFVKGNQTLVGAWNAICRT